MPDERHVLFEEEPRHAAHGERKAMSDISICLVVGAGGFIGANARYFIGRLVLQKWGGAFPYGTFIINILGCFILGLFGTLADRLAWNDAWRFLIAVGFVGAFTTFSTFEYETFQLASQGSLIRAGLNVLGSVVIGFLAAGLGVLLARLLLRSHP